MIAGEACDRMGGILLHKSRGKAVASGKARGKTREDEGEEEREEVRSVAMEEACDLTLWRDGPRVFCAVLLMVSTLGSLQS